jgi:hypothetical protein
MRRTTVARLILAVALALVGVTAALPSAAVAGSPVTRFHVVPSTTQAGGHPNLEIDLRVENRMTQHIPAPTCDCQDAKDITVHLPAGFIGDPHATPQCNAVNFGSGTCPPDSQVGYVELGLNAEEQPNPNRPEEFPGGFFGRPGVYNLVPHGNQAALLAINVPIENFPIYTVLEPRTDGDYGLDAAVVQINHIFPLHTFKEQLWGVPASPLHEELRHNPGCDPSAFENPPCHGVPATHEEAPFLDNPTTCGIPLSTSVDVISYDKEATRAEAEYPATTGCDQLSFNPSLYAQPTGTATETASGLDLDLKVPQFESPKVPSPSEIRAATVTLPEGIAINPNAADGKTVCSDAQAQLHSRSLGAQCPEASKVGTLSIESSALPGPLPGYLYLGEPKPGDRYRLVLAANGYGVHVKIIGSVHADARTGQLVASFPELPQAPFSDFNMHIFGSERGLLVTPDQCGTYAVKSTFTPWDSLLGTQTSEQFFPLEHGPDGSACPGQVRGFDPGFEAGVTDKTASKHAPFELRLTRNDGTQNLSSLTVQTPPGFSATLAGVAYCPEEALAALENPLYSGVTELSSPKCPASSQIGTAVSGAGAGTHPIYLSGKVYLAGPYKGAPLSLAVVTPAVSGPYDLGNVVVRAALFVDSTDAHITAVSNPFPPILEGIPLRLRSVLLQLDRPDFTLNPTDCEPFAVSATIGGDQGATVQRSAHFQVANCASLAFNPKLALRFSGSMKRSANPGLTATLTYPGGSGYANIAATQVTMPGTELIDNAHIRTPCTRVQYAANACPAASVIGFARAKTPLLDRPLEGPVYLRSSSHKLPDIVAALKGQIDIDLDGRIDSIHRRLRASFETVPDAPVSKFTLHLDGGKKGLLESSENLCAGQQRVSVRMVGQNGRVARSRRKLQTPCRRKRGKRRRAHHDRRAH